MTDEMEDVYLDIHKNDTYRNLRIVTRITTNFNNTKSITTKIGYVWYSNNRIISVDYIDYEKWLLRNDVIDLSLNFDDYYITAFTGIHYAGIKSAVLKLSAVLKFPMVYHEIDTYGRSTYYSEERWKARWQAQ